VPVLTGPLQALLALLPWILLTVLGLLISLLRPRVLWAGAKLLWRTRVTVLALGLVVASAILVWRNYGPKRSGGELSAVEPGDDWPMFRGGSARTGAVAGTPEPVQARLAWDWRDGRTAIFSSPAVVGNRVYVTTALTGLGGGNGRILCLDADTGKLVWQAAPPRYRATFSSPVVAGDRLVCGEGLHFIRDARVVCLDLSPGREGRLLWTFRTASHVECTPVIHDGKVYVGAGDDGYYCLELDPDANGNARVVWHVEGKDYPDAETALAVHDGRVYAGLGWGGKAICVLDAETGQSLGRIATDYPVFSPPAIAGGRLYVGMGNGDYVHVAEELGLEPAGALWCIDLTTLDVLWKYRVGRTVLGAPAVSDHRVYFGCRDGNLYCLDLAGNLVDRWNAYAPIITSPAVTERLVFVVNESGLLVALDRAALRPRWEFRVSSGPILSSSPAVARGRVFVGTEHDGLVAVGEPGEWNAATRVLVWPGPLGGPGVCGNRDDSPLADLGAVHWQYPEDQTGQSEASMVTAPPAAVDNDDLLVPLAGGADRNGIACLPADTAGRMTPQPRWFYATEHPVRRSPVVSGDTVLAVDGRMGEQHRRLYAVDRATGELQWDWPVAADASGTLGCTADEVFVQDEPQTLSCMSISGERLWSQPLGRLEHPPAAVDDLLVVALAEPVSLIVLDRPTGRELWRRALNASPIDSPVVSEQTIFVGTTRRLEAYSLLDGLPLANWRSEGNGVSGPVFVGRDVIAYASTDGKLTLLSRDRGKLLGECPGARPGLAPLPCRDRLLFFGETSILAVRFGESGLEGEPQPWADISRLGRPTGSMVLARGNIYAGMIGWGLVRLGAE